MGKLSFSEFLGPLIGGGLTDAFGFQVATMVSCSSTNAWCL